MGVFVGCSVLRALCVVRLVWELGAEGDNLLPCRGPLNRLLTLQYSLVLLMLLFCVRQCDTSFACIAAHACCETTH